MQKRERETFKNAHHYEHYENTTIPMGGKQGTKTRKKKKLRYVLTGNIDCCPEQQHEKEDEDNEQQQTTTKEQTRKRSDTSVYSVLFNTLHPAWYHVFAACAANRLMLYKIDDFVVKEDGKKKKKTKANNAASANNNATNTTGKEELETDVTEEEELDEEETVERTTLLQCYVDADPNETYYTCCWCSKKNALVPYIACAGAKGVVRVLNCKKKDFCGALVGHGGEINDLRAHPAMPNIIASASKDLSVRLWNVSNGVCVAIFAGARGHRNDVLSVDFHPNLHFCPESGREDVVVIATGGMDNAVKVWSTRGKKVSQAIEDSELWEDEIVEFPTAQVRAPEFSTFHTHNHFVDCVRYFGEVIFSKSVENKILAWTPDFYLNNKNTDADAMVEADENTNKNNDNSNSNSKDKKVGIQKYGGDDEKFKRSFRKLKSFNLVDAENWWVRFSLAKEASVLCCGNTKGLVRVWKFYESDDDSDADDDFDSSSSSSSSSSEEDDEKVKVEKDEFFRRRHRRKREKPHHHHTTTTNKKDDDVLVANLKGLPKETVVRQAEVSFDGKIVLAGCDGGYIYRWDIEEFQEDFFD